MTTFKPGPIGSTCQFTAALRYVETTCCQEPVCCDHMARQLCGDQAFELAVKELRDLQAAQGMGKHLRVPMRTRILEDWLLEELRTITGASTSAHAKLEVQVVSLGAGLDTRPWRLEFPSDISVHWICMDLPEVMSMKHALLQQANAQCLPRAQTPKPVAAAAAAANMQTSTSSTCQWPLRCASWEGLGLDLSAISNTNPADSQAMPLIESSLASAGFDRTLPTIWVMEAVLYYMPLAKAGALLAALASLSDASCGSRLIATCVDNELLEASRSLEAGHIFAQLWHFNCDELMLSKDYCQHWKTIKGPHTTKDIAKQCYNADTYVALYGGAECAFVASLLP